MVLDGVRSRIARLWDDGLVLARAMRDDRVPLPPKAVAALAVGYGLSPVDLIPDLLLGVGLLDDAVLVPAGLALAVRLIPHGIRQELRERAREDRVLWTRVGLAVLAAFAVAVGLAVWWVWLR